MRYFTLQGTAQHSPAQVMAALRDPANWSGEASPERDPERLHLEAQIGPQDMPAAIAGFVPENAQIYQDIYAPQPDPDATAAAGTVTITVSAVPSRVEVEITAESPTNPDSSSSATRATTVVARVCLDARVPVFGPMVESALEPLVRERIMHNLDKFGDFS